MVFLIDIYVDVWIFFVYLCRGVVRRGGFWGVCDFYFISFLKEKVIFEIIYFG